MTTQLTPSQVTPDRSLSAAPLRDLSYDPSLAQTLTRVRERVAPFWPLRHAVAVNPFLGLVNEPFADACRQVAHVVGARALMPRAFYRDALAAGRLTKSDLAAVLRTTPAFAERFPDVDALLVALVAAEPPAPASTPVLTVAEALDRHNATRLAPLAVAEISAWCARHWDEGQASWRSPWQGEPAFAAWRAEMRYDRTPDAMGLAGFRNIVTTMPADPRETIARALTAFGLAGAGAEAYLHRALASVGGWAAYARYLVWTAAQRGEASDATLQLLAIRVAWDAALLALHDDATFHLAWDADSRHYGDRPDVDLDVELVCQSAYERQVQRTFSAQLADAGTSRSAPRPPAERPPVQAAFCIDVRSEVYRRALEAAAPDVATIGFAGFFGCALEYVPLGDESGEAHCPVLLTPSFVVRETAGDEAGTARRRTFARRTSGAWKAFKASAVSSFAYVEAVGLAFAAKLVTDALGVTRPVARPRPGAGPTLHVDDTRGRATGISSASQIALAESALRGMSLTGGFARLVLLAGHGSSTTNNPHGTGLDCGACGGHTGEANARVAARVLNDPLVRNVLATRGVVVPDDTVFVAALHDTTTDAVTLFDRDVIPATHAADVARLDAWLAAASARARAERAPRLGGVAADESAITRRAHGWSQVRPEWGLAGAAAFVAAPRARTRAADLGGRAFLHSYDWRSDADFKVLELIMTAPMVVASWISLQYYGSTVDPRAFGAGDKTLHNVVGTLGVLEGAGGDLRVGLPLQSVHDGARFVHEPVRLNVYLEAPADAIEAVLARHDGVRALVEHGWLHLFRIADSGVVSRRVGNDWWAVERVPNAA